MGLPLLLLLLPASLQADHWAQHCAYSYFGMTQPRQLSAPEGGSVRIPFSFSYPCNSGKISDVKISWRWKHFHGDFIYNTTPKFIHKNFKDRLVLNWKEGTKNGSLQISNLRREDKGFYFCRVEMITERCHKQKWQSINGTNLTITHAQTTTLGSTTTTTTAGLGTSENQRSSGSWPLSTEATVGIVLAGAVLIIAIVGLIVYLWWKKSKGLQTKARTPARGSFQNTEEQYENIGNNVQQPDPKLEQNEDGIFYASLSLQSVASPPCPPPQWGPQEETLYSVLKA
uniref:Paired immunoglobin like type 2 receptor alpha n=1 Tax=Catagonus wagneri TaxID=51154 RepID=A0A8C3WPH5_9CETA